jgi:hypothetical protein
MKRPDRIYVLLGKISDGTFLNPTEYAELEAYISSVEKSVKVVDLEQVDSIHNPPQDPHKHDHVEAGCQRCGRSRCKICNPHCVCQENK